VLVATHTARLAVLSLELTGREAIPVGVCLEDPDHDRLYLRLRRDWSEIAPDEIEVLSEIEADLSAKADELGAARVMAYLEDTLSNAIRISDRHDVIVDNFNRAVSRLYRQHVSSTVKEYVTHLPRYSLAAAAGPFLENPEVEVEGWEETPGGLRLSEGMFVARVQGRSMEPLIADGSLCVFRKNVTGSRQGRLVLVEALGDNNRYTVKRYRSEKVFDQDGDFSGQSRITLEPLNTEFEAWDLTEQEDRYQIVAEFVQTLD